MEFRLRPLYEIVDSLDFRSIPYPKLDTVRELVRQAIGEVCTPTGPYDSDYVY